MSISCIDTAHCRQNAKRLMNLTRSFCMADSCSSKFAGSGCDSGLGWSNQGLQASGSASRLGASCLQAEEASEVLSAELP